jgi:anthranilate/para-aminobenzoate synthase component I
LSIVIRTAICRDGVAHFNVGAGIVADSQPEAEYEETLAKARGFFAALNLEQRSVVAS